MHIQCKNCQRQYDLDDAKIANVPAVKCECGSRLDLISKVEQNTLGKYILTQRIAVGGMGEIFYGKIPGIAGFEKEVAIKKMLPHISADRAFIDMMIKEAKLSVLLNHPNIVQVYDLDKQNEQYYIAMEYVSGVTVGNILEIAHREKKVLPVGVVMHIMMQVLRGLSYAHNFTTPQGEHSGILHRDITPQNIMVTEKGFVKITDFGIAKALGEISTTSPGMIKGKLGYIAPEQLEGKEADGRVDLFCAAILMWEMLTVKRLFKGSTEIDTFRMISEARIPPLHDYRTDVPKALEDVILKGLAKNPDDRYARGEQFITAISRAILPETPDSLAEITQTYFSENPVFFEKLFRPSRHKDAFISDLTGEMSQGNSVENLSQVNLYTSPNLTAHHSGSASKTYGKFIGIAACLMLVVGGAWYALKQGDSTEVPESVETQSNLPPTPDSDTSPALTTDVTDANKSVTASDANGMQNSNDQNTLTQNSNENVAPVIAPDEKVQMDLHTPASAPVSPNDKPAAGNGNDVASEEKSDGHEDDSEKQASKKHTKKPVLERRSANALRNNISPNKHLSAAEIQATVQRSQFKVARCMRNISADRISKDLRAHIVIERDGSVSEVELTPEPDDEKMSSCLVESMKIMQFRRQPVDGLQVEIPLRIQQVM